MSKSPELIELEIEIAEIVRRMNWCQLKLNALREMEAAEQNRLRREAENKDVIDITEEQV